jgi:hypothetical protein
MRVTKAIITSLAVLLLGGPVSADRAAAALQPKHCVVHVVGQTSSGELQVGPEACYGTFEDAMSAEGVDAWGPGAAGRASALATFAIGIHYDGANFTGPSMTVVGSNCSGGWLNVSAAWNNRISSTEHGCPRIRHYSGANRTGTSQTTVYPGGNLTTLNNLTSSLQYLT